MPDFRALLSGGGEMAERIRAFDWAGHPLGAPSHWPQSLRSTLSICLNSSFPTSIYWGSDLRLLYNDHWSRIPADRHPWALGRPGREVWADIWPVLGPQFEQAILTGRGYSVRDQMLPMVRNGRVEETYWDYSFTPIAGEAGEVIGILNQGQETTDRVLAQRTATALVRLSDRLRELTDPAAIIAVGVETAGETLGVDRVGYGELDEAGTLIRITPNWHGDGLSELSGALPLAEFGRALADALASGRPLVIDDTRSDPLIASDGSLPAYEATGMRSGVTVPVLRHGRWAAALFAHTAEPRALGQHVGFLLAVADRIWREVARARAEVALRDSEQRFRRIFEQAHDIVFTTDLDQRVTSANPAAAAALRLPATALIGRTIGEFLDPEDHRRTLETLATDARVGGTTQYEADVHAADGRVLRWEVNSTLSHDLAGHPVGLHAIARDVTERHAYEQRQRLLIDELNHRVKNTLAIVQSLAQQSFRSRGAADGQEAFGGRLSVLAAAHDLLTREKWEGATLGEVVAAATRPIAKQVDADGPAVSLAPKAAVSLALAFHELGTNAEQHGALRTEGGRVSVTWGPLDGGGLRLEWREHGGPRVVPPASRGFGLRVIERALGVDLGGGVRVDWLPDGLRCVIEAPAMQETVPRSAGCAA